MRNQWALRPVREGMLDGLAGLDVIGFVALEGAVTEGIEFDVEFHGRLFLVEKMKALVLEAGHQVGIGGLVGLRG